ncbi:MAG: hypothetical protein ABSG03_31575 [Bryobacteraceae bacterium]
MNASTISNGAIAVVNLTMAAGLTTTAIGISNSAASSPAGSGIALFATGGTVTGGAASPPQVLPTVASLSCLPAVLTGSGTATCTVALTGSAPTGGATVTLTNSDATLSVPASVTVAAGATTATFSASAATIGSNQSATITAAYNSTSATATISLLAPVLVSSLACNPTSLGQSAVSACTVTLTQTAPTGGSAVTLASTNNLLSVSASVTVAAGATSANFSATAAGAIASNQSATVTATLDGSSQTAVISLVAPVPPITFVQSISASQATGLFGAGQTASKAFPGSVTAGDLLIVGVFADVGAAVSVTDALGAAFAQVAHQTVTNDHDADVFVASAVASGGDTITVNAGSGSNVYAFSMHEYRGVTTAVDAFSTAQGISAGPASGGLTTINPNDLVFAWFTNGSNFRNENFSALNPAYTKREMSGSGTTQCFSYSNCVESGDLIAGAALTTNATATLNVSDIWSATVLAFKGGASTSLACNPTSLGPNSSSNCIVTLTQAAPTGGATVTLTNSNAALTVPASVTVTAGTTSATFSATTAAVASNQSATVTATYNSNSANATIRLVAPALASSLVSSLICNPASLGPNSSSSCTVTLTQAAPAGGAAVTLTNTNATLTVPASVMVPAAALSATFSATTAAIGSNQSATITAAYDSTSANATISLVAPVLVSSLACNPTSLGQSAVSACTVTLTQAASTGGSAVTLASSNNLLTVPVSVTVAAGATTANFSATAAATIASNQSATLTASVGGSSKTAAISLVSPVLVSGVACNPASLGPSSSSTCTVTLSQAAPAGGATVTLTNTNSTLTVPASVTVAAGGTSAAFNVTTTTVSSNQSATVTATLGSSVGSVVIYLVAAAALSSVSCTPTSLTGGSTSTCTVTLNKASVGSSPVSIASNNANLTVTSGLLIANGSASGQFTASAASVIMNNQAATITSTLNSITATATINLLGSVGVSSLSCSPASIGPNASTLCTITLTNAAPAGGAAVTLSNTNATLTVPASVTVSAGATIATFAATTSAIPSNQSATVTAAYNGSSANATISLAASTLVSSLVCGAATLSPSTSSTCTVTLTNAPAGGANVVVSTVNSLLTAPSSVAIAAGSKSASFALQAGSFTVNQSGSVTVSYNGSSQSVTVALIAPVLVTSLTCNPSAVISGATSSCTATLSQPAPTATTVTLSSTSTLITVPASIVITSGNASLVFSVSIGSISANATGSVIATLGTSSQTANFTLLPTPVLSSLTCAPTSMSAGSSSACTVTMSNLAGNVIVSLASNNAALSVPATVRVPQGSTSAGFSATTLSSASGWIVVSAVFNGTTKAVLLQITAASDSEQAQVNQISCTPKSLTAGSRGTCRITLDHVENSTTAELQLTSSSASLRLPGRVATSPGKSTVEFQVDAVSSGEGIVVAANLGSGTVKETLAVAPDRSTSIHVPKRQFVKYGTEVRFRVSPSDPAATLSIGALPAGAYFDSTTGEFRWTPGGAQLGAHEIHFTAVDAAGGKASASVTVQVDSGEPVVTGIVNTASRLRDAACSPGAIATIEGRWLAEGASVSDASGSSMELAGTKVWANGATVPILSASDTELEILCPDSAPGSEIEFVVQTEHGGAKPLRTTAHSAAPGIFSLDGTGTGQGWVLRESAATNSVAMVRNYRVSAQPAIPGERLLIYVTGLGNLTNISVQLGESKIPATAINPVPNHPGFYQVEVSMPNTVMQKDDLPLSLSGDATEGRISTNTVNIAVEANFR